MKEQMFTGMKTSPVEKSSSPKPEIPESDPPIERISSQALNSLVRHEILSPTEAAALEPGRVHEVMIRFAHDLAGLGSATEEQKRKIRRVLGLGSEQGDPLPQPEQRSKEIAELKAEMRSYLKSFQAEIPDVVGMILCGSRLDKNKLPGAKSDVDTVLVVKPGTETDPRTPEGEKNLFALRDFSDNHDTKSGFPVEIDEIYAADKFVKAMQVPEENSRLIWGWNPEAIAYIGEKIEDLNEDDVNSFLSLQLKSETADKLRLEMIRKAAAKIASDKK